MTDKTLSNYTAIQNTLAEIRQLFVVIRS